jgi:hypothetical protein
MRTIDEIRRDLIKALSAANDADRAYDAECRLRGYKCRWDVTAANRAYRPALQAAYRAKIEADEAAHQLWEEIRAAESAVRNVA